MYVNVDARPPVRFMEGWLDYQTTDKSWQRYWCVLRDEVMFLFNSQRESRETMMGSIAIGSESRCEKLDGDERLGYTFSLYTKRSLNNFKTSKAIDRELWKAYVDGVSRGDVSKDVDLLPGLIEDVRIKLKQFFMSRPQGTLSRTAPVATGPYLKSGFDTPDNSTSGSFDSQDYLAPVERRPSINYVAQKYRFHPDLSRTDIPSWFFSCCSRDLSVQILTVGGNYGNTLMRESTNDRGNLVISKRTESSSGHVFTHYIVQYSPQGYKIDVENPHEPKQSLSEVMEFFINTSGRSSTRPMTCNDLKVFGIETYVYNDYNKKIVASRHDPDSGEELADSGARGFIVPSTDTGPPDNPAPPLPHIKKNIKQPFPKVAGPQAGRDRSTSIPNIQAQLVHSELMQATKQLQGLPKSSGLPKSHILKTNNKDGRDSPDKSPVPPTSEKAQVPHTLTGPPLPPNHPPPLQKAHSQLTLKLTPESDTKKASPKHTQSMSSADKQVRKLSPRDEQSALKDELAKVTARIIKQIEPEEATPKPVEPVRSEIPTECLISPAAASDSFKKKLEGLFVNPQAGAPRTRPQNEAIDVPDEVYESISHYQNVRGTQNIGK